MAIPGVDYLKFKTRDVDSATISIATPTSLGLMSAADKAKLDSLVPGGSTTLQQAYNNGAAGPNQTIAVTAARGGVVIADAVVPLATGSLFSVTDSAGDLWFFVNGTGLGTPAFGMSATLNLQNTQSIGLALENSTQATAGVPVQNSPWMDWAGTAWNTGTLASTNGRFTAGVQMTSGNPISYALSFASLLGGVVYSISDTGLVTLAGTSAGLAGTYSIGGTPTLKSTVAVGTDNSFNIGDATHRLATTFTENLSSGAADMQITAARVGIGGAPTQKLTVTNAGGGNFIRVDSNGGTGLYLGTDGVLGYVQATTANEVVVIANSAGGVVASFNTGTNAVVLTGKISSYNGETTAGTGVPYLEKVGQDVASTGGGVQSTAIATFTPAATGLYRVAIVISATTADTVSAQVTYTDAVNTTAQTLTPISSVAVGGNGTTSATVLIRANTATNIVALISLSSQATTKASATIERLN